MERKRQRNVMAKEDRLSNLPESILLHILSLLPNSNEVDDDEVDNDEVDDDEVDNDEVDDDEVKEIVRTSVLSKRWRFLWKSVPVSLRFSLDYYDSREDSLDFVASTNRELHYLRSFQKIRKFKLEIMDGQCYAKDLDMWVHFATQVANVEDFTLELTYSPGQLKNYEFPKFAYKSTSLRNMVLCYCDLNASSSVNWTSLVSLSIGHLALTEDVMQNVLSGCPNLECLEIDTFWGHRLEINSEKLRKLILKNYVKRGRFSGENSYSLEILAPNIQYLQLKGSCHEIYLPSRNGTSLVNVILDFTKVDGQDNLEKVCRYFKELLHSVAHVENLELGPWCIQLLSVLELKGWQFPVSSCKFLKVKTALEHLDFRGICRLLQSSLHLIETMVIDWKRRNPRECFL